MVLEHKCTLKKKNYITHLIRYNILNENTQHKINIKHGNLFNLNAVFSRYINFKESFIEFILFNGFLSGK